MDTVINDKRSTFYYIGLTNQKKRKVLSYSILTTKEFSGIFRENLFSDVFFFPFAISLPINRKESQPKI